MKTDGDLTDLIERAQRGESDAAAQLFEALYPELRRIAHAKLRRAPRATLLDTTVVVHETYLRLVDAGRLRLEDRAHFLGYAGRVMRSVIVDAARARVAQRRGGEQRSVTLDSRVVAASDPCSQEAGAVEILAVHEALDRLADFGERLVQVVELRYFAGLTEPQIAETLGVSDRTVRRDWEKARLLLAEQLL